MSNINVSLTYVDDAEDVARIIDSPSMIDEEGVSPSAFNLSEFANGPESYLSVHRIIFGLPTLDTIWWKPRCEGDIHCGYAILNVGILRSIRLRFDQYEYYLKVESKSNPKNIPHAGVIYQQGEKRIKGQCRDKGFVALTTMLANMCELTFFDAC